ncbi:M91 family zinc metallopeptidase [Pseudomonas sp. HN11]|uniref:M91 family zinc metallopeptidase n=1 Tax=Pseudomonas sp. HN11 TaxID=1344094 RepID=UPI001F28933B|nr:M91 family zinc metallopeptidase [Pseudomonas sp. HN11]UII73313.1 M91 family zinc metallopeptidase [Pseudomonas sp. HN11]
METSPVSPSTASRSREEEINDAGYRQAADPAAQGANAAPNTANVPFMYSNHHDASRVEISSTRAGPVTFGGDNEHQRHARQSDTSQDEPYNQNAPSRDQVRAAARGKQNSIYFGGPPPIRITATQYQDSNVRIDFASVPAKDPSDPQARNEVLQISTAGGDNNVSVERDRGGGLLMHINGQPYQIPFIENSANQQRVIIRTGDGKDAVNIDYGGNQETIVDLGAGNDTFYGGSGRTSVFGGDGSDIINLGSGDSYAEGNDGNDFITGGMGNTTIYGGNGSDELRAGGGPDTKVSYVDGGNGNDLIFGGRGNNTLHGGPDDDFIYGGERNVIYTGRGRDTVQTYNPTDTVYGQYGIDDLSGVRSGAKVYHSVPQNVGRTIRIEGSKEFKQTMEDTLEFYRSSPVGQRMLAKIDSLEAPLILREGYDGSFYHYSDPGVRNARDDENRRIGLADGYIRDGVAGTPATNPVVTHQRNFITPGAGRPPVVVLYHEFAHAANGGEGTFFSGRTYIGHSNPRFAHENNLERQAVGLPSNHPPYHFNGPRNPASPYNPWPFTENALLEELGLPLRLRYFE